MNALMTRHENGVLTLTLPKKQAMSGAQRLTIE
jgi:HSP20 family molecular chaperone IbpA